MPVVMEKQDFENRFIKSYCILDFSDYHESNTWKTHFSKNLLPHQKQEALERDLEARIQVSSYGEIRVGTSQCRNK